MTTPVLRRAFLGLHLTVGLVILVESARTLVHALGAAAPQLHLGVLATVETLAAMLFLWPRTMRIGGVGLVTTFFVAMAAHLLRGEFPGPLLVYAAAVVFVMVHGSAAGPGSRRAVA